VWREREYEFLRSLLEAIGKIPLQLKEKTVERGKSMPQE